MSRINIQGTIENIRSKSNIYTPIVEAIINSIQSIVDKGFENVSIDSVFKNGEGKLKSRKFRFGKQYEIVVDEKIEDTTAIDTYAIVQMENIKDGHSFDKQIETISKKIL